MLPVLEMVQQTQDVAVAEQETLPIILWPEMEPLVLSSFHLH
jgi:hypothetical protein